MEATLAIVVLSIAEMVDRDLEHMIHRRSGAELPQGLTWAVARGSSAQPNFL